MFDYDGTQPVPAHLKGLQEPNFIHSNLAWYKVLKPFDDAPDVFHLQGPTQGDYRTIAGHLYLVGNRLASLLGGLYPNPTSNDSFFARVRRATTIRFAEIPAYNSFAQYSRSQMKWTSEMSASSMDDTIFRDALAEQKRQYPCFWVNDAMVYIDGVLFTKERQAGGKSAITDAYGVTWTEDNIPLAEFAKNYPALRADAERVMCLDDEARAQMEKNSIAEELRARSWAEKLRLAEEERQRIFALGQRRMAENPAFGIF